MGFFPSFFLSVLKVTNIFVLHINGSCDVHAVRTTPVCDVTMMYCKERYMENMPGCVDWELGYVEFSLIPRLCGLGMRLLQVVCEP